jgi:uncharacterized membrane protein YuzA (DUF378 family)
MSKGINLKQRSSKMKTLDILMAALLIVGGLNWGLVGLLNFDLVATILGSMTMLSRIIYAVVGVSAVYMAVMMTSIQRRWGLSGAKM